MAAPHTTAPRPGMALDEGALDAYLRLHVAGFAGPLTVEQFSGGQSNPTYLLSTPSRRYVLRKKPPGQILASAHAVDREFRVMRALGERTDLPVPQMRVLCEDESVIGTPFYVMEHVAGRIYRDPLLPELPREERRGYVLELGTQLARLHAVDPVAVGLGDFGKPTGYVARQIARWSKQYREDTAAGRVEVMEKLMEWLAVNRPTVEEPAAILHGDYRLDNVIFHPEEPRILAILDWELSSLGEARADVAYQLMRYRMPTLAVQGMRDANLTAHGIPDEAEFISHYCAAAGRKEIPDLDYFVAFCFFRFAGIFHGIRGRVARGNAVSASAREYAKYVEAIAEAGWAEAQRAGR